MRKIISRILIVAGILLIIATAVLVGYNFYDNWRAGEASDDVLDQIDDQKNPEEDTSTEESEDIPLYKLYPEMAMPTKTIDGYRYIAVLEIPSLDLKLPVMEEWDYTRLKIAPCRYSGSAYTNDLVIAGHNYRRHFSPIKWLKEGSTVILTDMDDNVFTYKVAYRDIIEPEDIKGMTVKKVDEKTGEDPWDLTLFTCTTGGGSRCAVRCLLDEDDDTDQSDTADTDKKSSN